ncbi:MAG: hypothetical protein ABIA21_00340 [Candidatus Aenigmatarchaeota archaeon]
MARKPGFNTKKIEAILTVLISNPDGLWLRRLAREAKISTTTVSKYVSGPLRSLLDEVPLGEGRPFLRVVRLKSSVFDRFQQGQTLGEVLRIYSMLEKANR